MPGFEIPERNLKAIDNKYKCPSCKQLLRDPVQLPSCGHHYCETCISSLRTSLRWTFSLTSGNLQCMVDGKYLSETEKFPDEFVKREILGLRVNCLWYDKGCIWEGEVREFEIHCSSCGFHQVPCPNADCGMVLEKYQLSNHTENKCPCRLISCGLCDDQVTANVMEVHQKNYCPGFLIRCPYCGKDGIPRGKMEVHLDALEGDCEVVELSCPFIIAGCSHTMKESRAQLRKHMIEDLEEHFSLMLLVLKDFTNRVADLAVNRRSCPSDNKKLNNVFRAVEYLCAEISRTSARTDDLESKLAGVRMSQQEMQRKWEGLRTCLESGSPTMSDPPIAMGQKHLLNFNDLQRQGEQTANTVRRLCKELNQLRRFVWMRVTDLEGIIEEYGKTLLHQSRAIAKLDSQVGTSYNGRLVWKIKNVSSWLLSDNNTLHSPVFYTGCHGYKMSVELAQRLCQSGLGECISLSFVIMRGDFDSILRWPFQQKIAMKVIDQDEETSQRLSHKIIPIDSAPFKRPESNKNVPAVDFASSWPKSTLLNHPGYIKEDTMFIEIIVDTSNLK